MMSAPVPTHADLIAELLDVVESGNVPPCVEHYYGDWVADDAGDQAYTAQLCRWCPALLACRAYGLAHPSELGVYGGLTERERRARVSPESLGRRG